MKEKKKPAGRTGKPAWTTPDEGKRIATHERKAMELRRKRGETEEEEKFPINPS